MESAIYYKLNTLLISNIVRSILHLVFSGTDRSSVLTVTLRIFRLVEKNFNEYFSYYFCVYLLLQNCFILDHNHHYSVCTNREPTVRVRM